MIKDEALKLALEALDSKYIVGCGEWRGQQLKALAAIKEALAQPAQKSLKEMTEADFDAAHDIGQPAQEPVAEVELSGIDSYGNKWRDINWYVDSVPDGTKLYTTPPQRPWVGLMRGVRVEGDTVIISVKGKFSAARNDAARELCSALIKEMEA